MRPTYDPLDLNGQQAAAEDAEDALKLARKREEDDLKHVMGGKPGRRVIWRFLEVTNVALPTRSLRVPKDSNETYANLGKYEVGIALQNQLMKICPELYFRMQQEATNG